MSAETEKEWDYGQCVFWRELYGDSVDKYTPVNEDWASEWYNLDVLTRITLNRARRMMEVHGGLSLCGALSVVAFNFAPGSPGADIGQRAVALHDMMVRDPQLAEATVKMMDWAWRAGITDEERTCMS